MPIDVDKIASAMSGIIADDNRIITEKIDCIAYSRDMSVHAAVPDLVVQPLTTEEVRDVVKYANENDVPLTPRGSGTSVTGAIIPVRGGIVVDMSKMNKIKEINIKDHYAIVEPGVVCGHLNRELAPKYFFPPDPGSSAVASIGGMISTNASGLRAVKYGTTKDYVTAVEYVTPTGEIVRTGHKVPKASAGYDITHLIVSAEGTLGLITEATLKIVPTAEKIAFCLANFKEIQQAGDAAAEILSSGIPLCACEIMDRVSLDVVSEKMGLDLEGVNGMLIMEVDGHPAAVDDQLDRIKAISEKHGALRVHASDEPAERGKIWAARSGLVSALSRYAPGQRLIPIAEDFGVPISRIPEAIEKAQALSKKHDIVIATFGHVGDGNLHTTFILDPRDKDGWEKVKSLAGELNKIALDVGGTVSAEHGIGLAKVPFIGRELGKSHDVMKSIKRALDPKNIMNPGKLGLDDAEVGVLDAFAFGNLPENPEKISSLGTTLADEESLLCSMCGFCRAVCPAFGATGSESDNARGKIQLAYALRSGVIEPSEELARKFYMCTTCENCTKNCPSAIDVAKVVEGVRTTLVKAGFMPEEQAAVCRNVESAGNPFGLDAAERTDIFPKDKRDEKPEQAEVLVYMGCTSSYVDMKIIPSLFTLMDTAGVDYTVLGGGETCCGLPVEISGDLDEFKSVANKTAAALVEYKPKTIVTPCAGCYKTLASLYPKYVDGWDVEVKSTVQYLEELIESGKLKLEMEVGMKAAYHDPCHLGRHMGVFDAPRNVLSAVPGFELVEFPTNRELSTCCGGGGGMPVTAPEMSNTISAARVRQALALGVNTIVSACPFCKDQLKKGAAAIPREEGRMRVMDVVEVVRKAVK